ncbi:TIGR03915 family putative DNA repair protein [Gramella sp. AN32]|uniref:TIGR03915 family putative DNA repair protein n=1 Tax=Christiangramia antarctica TaxID=2058158 RepID=A0ABW5X361_9FLAO|nr:TIGR03915 family putative DNA repair protein [Gramella sp. AN32]MCM4157203.1 DNA metabolism protein [Gramella sp. AN32]
MNSVNFTYDGTFEGLLTCVFTAYEGKLQVSNIQVEEDVQNQLFSDIYNVITDVDKAKRVAKKLQLKTSPNGFKSMKWALLSEIKGIEMDVFEMIREVISNDAKVDTDYSHPSILKVTQMAKKISREKHRMEAFIRFRLTKDHIYFAVMEPDFNVLPVIIPHFTRRYADQKWIIYDLKRKIGAYYDLKKTEFIQLNLDPEIGISGASQRYFHKEESNFQILWQEYFTSTNIKSRINMRLHQQHVPKRYWKYLSEKSTFG